MVQADAKQKLMTLSMGRNESITEALLDPLSADLRRTLIVFNSLNNDATASLEPISDTIVKIKSIYTLFENQNSWDRLADAFTPSKQTDRKSHRDRRDKRRVREHKPYDRNDSKHTEKTSRTYCSYHNKYNPHRHHDRSSRDRKQKKSHKDTDMEDATDSDQDQNLTVKS
ncbi:hypothetical protein V8B55DRAFT_1306212, partial [Mucor lusitanicus]